MKYGYLLSIGVKIEPLPFKPKPCDVTYLFKDILLLAACVVKRLENSLDSSSTRRYKAAAVALLGGPNILKYKNVTFIALRG